MPSPDKETILPVMTLDDFNREIMQPMVANRLRPMIDDTPVENHVRVQYAPTPNPVDVLREYISDDIVDTAALEHMRAYTEEILSLEPGYLAPESAAIEEMIHSQSWLRSSPEPLSFSVAGRLVPELSFSSEIIMYVGQHLAITRDGLVENWFVSEVSETGTGEYRVTCHETLTPAGRGTIFMGVVDPVQEPANSMGPWTCGTHWDAAADTISSVGPPSYRPKRKIVIPK
jgi:hypothetical protein